MVWLLFEDRPQPDMVRRASVAPNPAGGQGKTRVDRGADAGCAAALMALARRLANGVTMPARVGW